jgi:hypothetical protein
MDKDAICNLLGQDFNRTRLSRRVGILSSFVEFHRCAVASSGHQVGSSLGDGVDWHGLVAWAS